MKKILIGFIVLAALLYINPCSVNAEDANPISVKELLPENQINKDVTYYDLRLKPGGEQDIEVELLNSSNKEVNATIQVNPARTSDTGDIDYNRSKNKKDASLKYPINELITTEENISIPANGTYRTKLHIKMPVEGFDGMVLGGIYVTENTTEADASKEDSKSTGMAVINKMAFVKGIKLSETNTEVTADMKLLKTFASQVMFKNTVKVNLQNPTSTTIDDLKINAKIFSKESSNVLYKSENIGYRMAPNSNFNYGIYLENQAFKAGDYSIKLNAESIKTGQNWEFDDTFTITSKEAKKLNDKAIDLEKDDTMLYVMIGVGLLLFIIVIIILIVILKKRKKKKEALLRKKRKKRARERKHSAEKISSSSKSKPPKSSVKKTKK